MIPTPNLPFALPITTRIICPVISSNTTYDQTTGNMIPGVDKVELTACLTDSGSMGDAGQQSGLNVGVTYLQGFILSPIPLPDGVKLIGTVPAFHTYPSGITQEGIFTFSETPNPFSELIKVAGIPVTGSFKNSGGN